MIRSITTQFLPALRQAGSRRLNSGGGTIAVSNRESEYEKFMTPFKDPGIKAGNHAYVWEVPKNLPSNDFIKRREAVATHAESTTELWRKISFYICIPAIICTTLWVYKAEMAHEEHHRHIVEANGGVEPERKVYAYMNMRNKPFPWGNQSLFFNPKTNIPVEEP